jgi:hypothetical protein
MSDSIPAPVAKLLPDLVPEGEFIDRTYEALGRHGLANNSALAMVGACRDELSVSLSNEVERVWGAPFILTGLGGYITAGTTGFGAGHAHAPKREPAAYVYVAMPHLAVDDEGTLGHCRRPGMPKVSHACGALWGVKKELDSKAGINAEFDPADPEYSLLKAALVKKLKPEMDLLEITRIARKLIQAQVKKAAAADSDYALITGIQVHLASGQYVFEGKCQVRVGGKSRSVKW